jgi:hypothetical protein
MKEENNIQNNTLKIFVCDVIGDKGYEEEKYPSPFLAMPIFETIIYSKSLEMASINTYAPNAPGTWFKINFNSRQFA